MARQKNLQQEQNRTAITLAAFLDFYNRNLPQGFPSASAKKLEKFRAAHPLLFKSGSEWTVDKHRKRVMDWLSSHHDD